MFNVPSLLAMNKRTTFIPSKENLIHRFYSDLIQYSILGLEMTDIFPEQFFFFQTLSTSQKACRKFLSRLLDSPSTTQTRRPQMYADNNTDPSRKLFDLACSLYSIQTLSVIGDTYLIPPVITSLPEVRGGGSSQPLSRRTPSLRLAVSVPEFVFVSHTAVLG